MREVQEVERLWFPVAPSLAVPGGVAPELDEAGLVGLQLQTELDESLAQVGEEPLRISVMLEPGDEIVSEAHDDDVAAGLPTSPLPGPPVEHVVQVHVGEQR